MTYFDEVNFTFHRISRTLFVERLEIGKEVRLIRSFAGPVAEHRQVRTIKRYQTNNVVFDVNGKESELRHEVGETYYDVKMNGVLVGVGVAPAGEVEPKLIYLCRFEEDEGDR